MNANQKLLSLVEVPEAERKEFDEMIKLYREKYIRNNKEVVDTIFNKYPDLKTRLLKNKEASGVIREAREYVWREYLEEESEFNAIFVKDLTKKLKTPNEIAEQIIKKNITGKNENELIDSLKDLCGEYAGRISPYIYRLSLSTTQSRRSRSGSTFEAIIYKIYDYLKYPFDSQTKVGRKVFDDAGLGKKVDSILPGIEEFRELRSKTIIGTMKTSLRERWQEVAEEIERTKIPEIHLLTADTYIPFSKASEMAAHNIRVVAYEDVAEDPELEGMKNIISFEEYLFEEIPIILKYWKK